MVKSAYIHIPFCKSKCNYCSFISFDKLDLKKDYLKTLAKEIKYFYKGELLETLYFGGGTPSLLTPDEIENIVKLFNINENTEFTIEVNPEGGNYDFFRGVYDAGVNRISLGCQSFDDTILRTINRRHNAGQIIDAVHCAKNAGFKNISLDFIYGLPGHTIDEFLKDLKTALELGIQHISLYGLKLEPDCYFYSHLPQNLPDDDMQADMYLAAVEFLERNNFHQYEVSNFSQRGFYSRHNCAYWKNQEYYGFGTAAHGYVNGIRYENHDTIEKYIADYSSKKETKLLSNKEKLEEEIFLGFRLEKGIETAKINLKYNINFDEKYKKVLDKYLKAKLLEKTNLGYKLTLQGILLSNVVLADFLED